MMLNYLFPQINCDSKHKKRKNCNQINQEMTGASIFLFKVEFGLGRSQGFGEMLTTKLGTHHTEPQAGPTNLCTCSVTATTVSATHSHVRGRRADMSSWHRKDFLVFNEVRDEANLRRGTVKI